MNHRRPELFHNKRAFPPEYIWRTITDYKRPIYRLILYYHFTIGNENRYTAWLVAH